MNYYIFSVKYRCYESPCIISLKRIIVTENEILVMLKNENNLDFSKELRIKKYPMVKPQILKTNGIFHPHLLLVLQNSLHI